MANTRNRENDRIIPREDHFDTDQVHCRVILRNELSVFSQYLLPNAAMQAARGGKRLVILGAVFQNLACGAAALRLPDPLDGGSAADLLSLFVDPMIRRRGTGTRLLNLAVEKARDAGADWLDASYTAEGEDVQILHRMFRKLGADPESNYSSYSFDSSHFHGTRLLRNIWSCRFRPPQQIVQFSDLNMEQIRSIEADPELPANLMPGRMRAMDPTMSLAWVNADGTVSGFILGCMSSPGNYANLSTWCTGGAPFGCFYYLLKAQLQRCFYHSGGDFIYHVCSTSAYMDALAEGYSGGKFKKMQLYSVRIDLEKLENQAERYPKEEN